MAIVVEYEWGTVRDTMDLCVISQREDVGVQVPGLGVLFNKMTRLGNNGAVVPLE